MRILISLKSRGRVIGFNGLERTEPARLWLAELYTAMEGMPGVSQSAFQRLFHEHRKARVSSEPVAAAQSASDVAGS